MPHTTPLNAITEEPLEILVNAGIDLSAINDVSKEVIDSIVAITNDILSRSAGNNAIADKLLSAFYVYLETIDIKPIELYKQINDAYKELSAIQIALNKLRHHHHMHTIEPYAKNHEGTVLVTGKFYNVRLEVVDSIETSALFSSCFGNTVIAGCKVQSISVRDNTGKLEFVKNMLSSMASAIDISKDEKELRQLLANNGTADVTFNF